MTNSSLGSILVRQTGAVILVAALALSCLTLPTNPAMAADDETAERLEFTVTRHQDYYKAKNRWFKLYVSIRLVDMKADEKPTGFIPLIFGVWNRRDKAFYVDREHVRLLDRYGNEVPMANLEDLRKNYPHLRRDQQHRDFTTFGGRFTKGDSRLVPTNFFPPPGTALVTTAQVHRHRRVKDLVYFEGAIEPGEPYRLVITLRKSGEELVIPFEAGGDAGDGKPLESTVSGSITIGG